MPEQDGILTPAQAATLDAIAARLIPSDENGPGAREAGAVRYVERALAADYREHLAAYADGLAAVDAHARGTHGGDFATLAAEQQDAVLCEFEHGQADGLPASSAEFFELVRRHVLEGMFGDPLWGGNAGFVGWELLSYPGPRLEWSSDDQRLDAVPTSERRRVLGSRPTKDRARGRASTADRHTAADVVLIGLGAAGGVAAHVLTEAGLEVVALEAGPRLDPGMMTLDEIRNDVRGWMSAPKAASEVPTWRTDPSATAGPSPWPMLMVNAVGGSTVHYPGLSARLHAWNFRSRSSVIARYGADAIPEGSTLVDWPISYEELEPYYDLVEHAIGVAGHAGNLGSASDPAGSVFEAARRRAYPMPALRRTGWTELTASAARRLGWHPFPAPAAINSEPYNGHPSCTYCGFCSCNGCYRSAKGSADSTVIARAEATGRLRIETEARALRLEVDAEGLVSGVTYVQDGRERLQPAASALLGSFTYENTRLLLLSRSKAYPRGLSNNSGQVGQHYMAHVTPFAFGVFPGRRLNLFNGLWAQATCVDDWNADNFDHSQLGFIGGALLTASHELKPIATATEVVAPSVPRFGSTWKAWLRENAQSLGSVNAQLECLPYEANFLDLDPVAKDPHGVPVVRVTHRPGENERRGHEFMREKLECWLAEAGASETWSRKAMLVEGRHCYGGTRMGDDPETSVVDRFGFSHEVPNLGLLGASTFPTTGGHNPTLTVQALAWRTAEHLVERRAARARAA